MIGSVDVLSPCVANFGSRDLIIDGKLRVPNGGTLSLTARTITVRSGILGRHTTYSAGKGADVSLIATGGIALNGRIDVSGRVASGSVLIDSGGNVVLRDVIRSAARGSSATAPGGNVTVRAGGTLFSTGHGRVVDIRGGRSSSGGDVTLQANGSIHLAGRIDARGSNGGSIAITSSAGDVILRHRLQVTGRKSAAGSISIDAAGSVDVTETVDADGRSDGGIVQCSGSSVTWNGQIRVRGHSGHGGSVILAGNGAVAVNGKVAASGHASGGSVWASSTTAGIVLGGKVEAEGITGSGGVVLLAAGGNLQVNRDIDAKGRSGGGRSPCPG